MPLEIKELIIRATIDSAGADSVPATNGASQAPALGNDREEIIAACVEQVLQILKDKEER